MDLTYSRSVLLQERHGVGLVFDEIQTTVYRHGFTPWSPAYYGVWRLAPNGKIGIPLQVSLTCPIITAGGVTVPVTLALWHLTLVGKSDQGRPAKIGCSSFSRRCCQGASASEIPCLPLARVT